LQDSLEKLLRVVEELGRGLADDRIL